MSAVDCAAGRCWRTGANAALAMFGWPQCEAGVESNRPEARDSRRAQGLRQWLAGVMPLILAVPAAAEWRAVEQLDEFHEPTGEFIVSARTGFADGRHWCELVISPVPEGEARANVALLCDRLDLVGGDNGRYDVLAKLPGKDSPATIGLLGGGTIGIFNANYTTDGDTYETGGRYSRPSSYYYPFADEIFESMHDAGAALTFSLPFRTGRVVLSFPLDGLAVALDQAGGFDTRRYTQYESTTRLTGDSVMKSVFWLHESDFDEYATRNSDSRYKTTYEVRQSAGATVSPDVAARLGELQALASKIPEHFEAVLDCGDGDAPCQTAHLARACLSLRDLRATMGLTLGPALSDSIAEASANCDQALPHVALGDRNAAAEHLAVMGTHIAQATTILRDARGLGISN